MITEEILDKVYNWSMSILTWGGFFLLCYFKTFTVALVFIIGATAYSLVWLKIIMKVR